MALVFSELCASSRNLLDSFFLHKCWIQTNTYSPVHAVLPISKVYFEFYFCYIWLFVSNNLCVTFYNMDLIKKILTNLYHTSQKLWSLFTVSRKVSYYSKCNHSAFNLYHKVAIAFFYFYYIAMKTK